MSEKNRNNHEARHAARLAAVQALYQSEQAKMPADVVMQEFLDHRLHQSTDKTHEVFVDTALFKGILKTWKTREEDIDAMLSATLVEGWALDRLESVLRAVLRAGCAEFLLDEGNAGAVIISEYVTVAKEFYSHKEPGFVNGVLDRIACTLNLPMHSAEKCDANFLVNDFIDSLAEEKKISGTRNWEDEGGHT